MLMHLNYSMFPIKGVGGRVSMTKKIQLIQIIWECSMLFGIETNSTSLRHSLKAITSVSVTSTHSQGQWPMALLASILPVVFLLTVRSSSSSVQFLRRYIFLSNRMNCIHLAVVTLGQIFPKPIGAHGNHAMSEAAARSSWHTIYSHLFIHGSESTIKWGVNHSVVSIETSAIDASY